MLMEFQGELPLDPQLGYGTGLLIILMIVLLIYIDKATS